MSKGHACVVRGCKSKQRSLRHRFPKDPVKSYVWSCAINNLALQQMGSEARRKFSVCHLHFSEESYKVTLNRCKLLDTAVPALNIPRTPNPNMEVSVEPITQRIATGKASSSTEFLSSSTEIENLSKCSSAVQRETEDHEMQDPELATNECGVGQVEPDGETVPAVKVPASIRKNSILGSSKRQTSSDTKAQALCKKAVLFKRKYDRLRREFKKHRRNMDPITTGQLAEKFTASLTRVQKQFWNMLLQNSNNAPSGRRFTVEQRLFCLSLYEQSPSCYRFLSSFFPLPSRTTLMKLLCKVPVKTGIMDEVIQHLQDRSENMKDEREKACILIWDEVRLEPHITYDATSDKIVGVEDWGSRRSTKIADHCLVFMVKGLQSGWKVPISYNFCEAQTSSPQLMHCIKEVVTAIERTGLKVIASVCDPGSSNVSAIENLLLETNTKRFRRGEQLGDTIEIGNTKFFPLYDVPHLLKGIRNNFLNADLEVGVDPILVRKSIYGRNRRFASWDIIQLAYKIDVNGRSRQLKKLTEEHIFEKKMKKMKVKYAAQILSETLANYIEFTSTISGHINSRIGPLRMPETEGLATAEILKFFNDLFDSLNGHKTSAGLGLKGLLTSTSDHHTFWVEACRKLRGMRFVDKKTKKSNSKTNVPIMTNWVRTIVSVQNVWKVVREMGFQYLETRHLNQDCLENLFGQMRSHGGRNVQPSCAQFQGSFKAALINNLMSKHSVGANCENLYDGENLTPLRRFVEIADQIRRSAKPLETGYSRNADAESGIVPLSDLDDEYASTNDEDVSPMITAGIKKIISFNAIKGCQQCQDEIGNIQKDDIELKRIYTWFTKRISHVYHDIQEKALF